MTMVASWRQLAKCRNKPPLEVCVKGASSGIIKGVMLPKEMRFSLAWSLSGSYDKIRFLAYLECWLDPWTPERAKANDYRLLYGDVASGHLGQDVIDFCWQRGYVYLLHYGGTTSIMQVNDTACHGDFEAEYLEVEQASFNRRHLSDPGNVSRSLQEVLDDVVTTWRTIDHCRAVDGHKNVGLSIPLNGTGDGHISGEAREVWMAVGMADIREKALAEIDAAVADKTLTCFADVFKVIKDPVQKGEYTYGQEFEGKLKEGEKSWNVDADDALLKADAADIAGDWDAASCLFAGRARWLGGVARNMH